MSIWNVINLAGGLAMFIFGMNLMSDGLKLVAGSYLKKILEKLTKNLHYSDDGRCGTDRIDSEFQCHVCHGSWFCKCRYDAVGAFRWNPDGSKDWNNDYRTVDCL